MEYVDKAKNIQSKILKEFRDENYDKISEHITELDSIYNFVNYLAQEIRLVKLNTKNIIVGELRTLNRDIKILEKKNPSLEEIKLLKLSDFSYKELAPGISLPVMVVPDENYIPSTPLYYIKNTEEFGVKVLDTVISGKIGNFVETTKAIQCPKRSQHDTILCKWSHATGNCWIPEHFLYTRDPVNSRNINLRHIGSRDSLLEEIFLATKREKESRVKQTAHDLLVQLCINHCDNGYVKET
jgi:hypothetical protein